MIVLSRRRSLSRTCTAAAASVLALAIPAGPVHALNTDAAATHPALEIDYQPLGAANPPAADRDAWKVIRTASLPGFGGSYLDRATNVLHVWTTQPSRLSRQQAADVLVGDDQDRVGANGRVQVHRADYTFAELKTWSDRLLRKLFSDDGMALGLTWKDIDERSNSIEVGLEDPSRKAGPAARYDNGARHTPGSDHRRQGLASRTGPPAGSSSTCWRTPDPVGPGSQVRVFDRVSSAGRR